MVLSCSIILYFPKNRRIISFVQRFTNFWIKLKLSAAVNTRATELNAETWGNIPDKSLGWTYAVGIQYVRSSFFHIHRSLLSGNGDGSEQVVEVGQVDEQADIQGTFKRAS